MEEVVNNMVKVYTAPVCLYCHSLKQFLKEHNIEFEEINVAENKEAAEEMIKKSAQMGVPVVDINGEIVVGFNKEKISQLLGIKD